MQKRTIINVHIEKTGGTSILKFFENTLGKDSIGFYDPSTDSIIRVSDLLISPSNELINKLQLKSHALWFSGKKIYFSLLSGKRSSATIMNDILIVHGHFKADRFKNIVSNPYYTVVIRNPLTRMISHYNHWKSAKGRNQSRINVGFDPSMTFEDYALLPIFQNYQSQALGGRSLTNFDIVGITEDITSFSRSYFNLFIKEGYIAPYEQFPGIQKLNQSHTYNVQTGKTFLKRFRKFHDIDYGLYEQARSINGKGM